MSSFPNETETREALLNMLPSYFDNASELNEMIECAKLPTPLVRHIFSKLNDTGIAILPEHDETVKDCIFLWG